jgi:hypothetical protein
MRHLAAPFRVTLAALPLILLLAGCGPSEQEKRLKALAGTYVHDTEFRSPADAGGMRVHERQALTLKADGTWTMVRTVEVNGQPQGGGTDSGRFGVSGSTLNVHSEESGMLQYTASGDTLWARNARMVAMTKAVTGMSVNAEDSFLVRER